MSLYFTLTSNSMSPDGRRQGLEWAAPFPGCYKFGFRSSVQKNSPPGKGRHEGLVPRNDVLMSRFIRFSLARTLARILFEPLLRCIRCIDVSIQSFSEFQKTCLCKFSACLMFLDVSCTIFWRCKLKSPQNGNLKKSIIHLSRVIIHMTYTTFIFLQVF